MVVGPCVTSRIQFGATTSQFRVTRIGGSIPRPVPQLDFERSRTRAHATTVGTLSMNLSILFLNDTQLGNMETIADAAGTGEVTFFDDQRGAYGGTYILGDFSFRDATRKNPYAQATVVLYFTASGSITPPVVEGEALGISGFALSEGALSE